MLRETSQSIGIRLSVNARNVETVDHMAKTVRDRLPSWLLTLDGPQIILNKDDVRVTRPPIQSRDASVTVGGSVDFFVTTKDLDLTPESILQDIRNLLEIQPTNPMYSLSLINHVSGAANK